MCSSGAEMSLHCKGVVVTPKSKITKLTNNVSSSFKYAGDVNMGLFF